MNSEAWRRLAWLVTAAALAACTTWQELPRKLDEPSPLPYTLRVTRRDGARLTMVGPHILADTLWGRRGYDSVMVPLREIALVEHEEISVARTTAAVLAIPAAFVVIWYIHCGNGQCGPQPVY